MAKIHDSKDLERKPLFCMYDPNILTRLKKDAKEKGLSIQELLRLIASAHLERSGK